MEIQTIHPDYQDVLIQWAFLFGLVATWLIPAFLFRKVAVQHNKTGWPYFILGLGVGAGSMFLSGFVMRGITALAGVQVARPYVIAVFLIMPALLIVVAFTLFKRSFSEIN